MTGQQPAADAPKRNCNDKTDGAAALATSAISAPPHYGEIAAAHLATACAGPALQAIADLVRRMRDGDTAGGKGSSAIRTLREAARAAAAASEHLRRVDILAILEALWVSSPREQDAPYQMAVGDFNRLHLADRFDTTLLALDRLAIGLEDAAKRANRQPRGAPRRPGVLLVALDQLERIWWQHREIPPNQSVNTGGFGALARAILTAPPCNYGEGTVRKAIAEYLKQTERPALMASRAPQVTAPPKIEAAVIISDGHAIAKELGRQLGSDGAQVRTQSFPASGNTAPPDIATVPKSGIDLLILTCLTPPFALGTMPQARRIEAPRSMDAEAIATIPARLHATIAAYRQLLRRSGGKVVVLMPDPASVAAAGGSEAYSAAPVLAAIRMMVGMWAQDLAKDGILVSAMSPAWGVMNRTAAALFSVTGHR